jgi:hypothetical protein
VFPYPDQFLAGPLEQFIDASIPRYVALELVSQESGVGFWSLVVFGTPMPEAAVKKCDGLATGKDNAGCPPHGRHGTRVEGPTYGVRAEALALRGCLSSGSLASRRARQALLAHDMQFAFSA